MNLKKRNSRSLNVNLLSDYLLSKIPSSEKTIIQIADCNNFFIIKGKTSSKDLLDLPKIIEEYIERFQEYIPEKINPNTIDLIEYDSEINEVDEVSFDFYNTENCSYSHKEISKNIFNEDMIVCSEFPHGYSLDQGRALYYYLKNIVYSIPTNFIFTSLTFKLKKKKEIELKVYNNFFTDNEEDETLQSAILDCFDFDTSEIENKMKKVEWFQELTNPLSEYDFLKEVKKDFIII